MSNASQISGAADWQHLLFSRTRQRAAGRAIATVGKAAVMDLGSITPRIDVARMSASATITTPTPDRSEDVVHPEGVLLENYRRNPVVFYDHGFSGIMLPIGKSEDPDGNLTLVVTPEGIDATTYFAQSLCEACQVFALIEEGIVKSTSIGFMPLEALPRTAHLDGGRPGLEITVWELLEYSWVGIPDNPEAVRKVLDRGRLAGSPICDPILKSLSSFAAPVVKAGRGWEPSSMNSILTNDAIPSSNSHEDVVPKELSPPLRGRGQVEGDVARNWVSASLNDESLPGPSATLSRKSGEGLGMVANNEVSGTIAASDTQCFADKPLGAQVLEAVFDGLTNLSAQVNAAMGPLENPQVKTYLTKLAQVLNGSLGETQSAYTAAYPDINELQPANAPEEQTLAKFLGKASTNRQQLSNLVQRLKGLQTAPNLTSSQRADLTSLSSRLSKLTQEARHTTTEQPTDPDQHAHVVELVSVKQSVQELIKRFEDLLPRKP